MDNLEKMKTRTQQYWFSDGLNEIGLGLIFIILGIYFYIDTLRTAEGLVPTIVDTGLFILIFLGSGWVIKRGIQYFKEKLTYPRTGFLSYKDTRRFPRWVYGLISGIAGAVIGMILATGNMMRWLPAFTGSVLCLVLLYIAFRIHLLRFHLLALIAFVLGVLLSLTLFEPMVGTSAVYGLTGLSILFSGICTLAEYLRTTSTLERKIDE